MTAPYTLQSRLTHQTLHRVPSCPDAFSPELLPDLYRAIALHVGVPHALDLQNQYVVTSSRRSRQERSGGLLCSPAVKQSATIFDLKEKANELDEYSNSLISLAFLKYGSSFACVKSIAPKKYPVSATK